MVLFVAILVKNSAIIATIAGFEMGNNWVGEIISADNVMSKLKI